jgi:hypothetical protein
VGHSLPSKFLSATITASPRGHSNSKEGRNLTGLTVEETIEFEAIDVLDPFDDSGNIAWAIEGEPDTLRENRAFYEASARKVLGQLASLLGSRIDPQRRHSA